MKQLFYAILALAYASSALACAEATGSGNDAPRGYYRDDKGRYCYESTFKGKLYRSCY